MLWVRSGSRESSDHPQCWSLIANTRVPCFPPLLVPLVHEEGAAITDATKIPARPLALEACASEQGPPLHSHPACLPGSALDCQVYPCSHHLPHHGDSGLGGILGVPGRLGAWEGGQGLHKRKTSLSHWPWPSAWLGILGQRKMAKRCLQVGSSWDTQFNSLPNLFGLINHR